MRNTRITLLVLLFGFTSNLVSGQEKAIPIQPDHNLQARIDRLMRASQAREITDAERGAAEREFRELTTGPHKVEFLRQLLYYSLTAPSEKLREGVIWIVAYPHLAPQTVVDAVLPYMETENEELRLRIRVLLQGRVERCSPSECLTLSHYTGTLRRNRANPPPALVRYMFRRDPSEALRQFMAVYAMRPARADSAANQELRWADHIVSDAMKKGQFVKRLSASPGGAREAVVALERLSREEAGFQLERLSKSDDWWVRMYVAAIMRQHPAFRRPDIVARLEKDSHPLVREAMGYTQPPSPPPRAAPKESPFGPPPPPRAEKGK